MQYDKKIAGRYEPEDFDVMVDKVKQLAKEGPRKIVWDPIKKVYKTVPVTSNKANEGKRAYVNDDPNFVDTNDYGLSIDKNPESVRGNDLKQLYALFGNPSRARYLYNNNLLKATPKEIRLLLKMVAPNGKLRPLVGQATQDKIAEDWQKVNKSDKTDGMSSKAVKAYRRENPGSKLKTAVTTKPSKLKKGSKDAKRRKSFCARMSGMKKAHASAKTKRDPNSPINKALRRWNCESIEQLKELVMIAEQYVSETKKSLKTSNPCWDGYKPVGTKQKQGKTVPNCVPMKKESAIMKGLVDEQETTLIQHNGNKK